MRAALVLVSLSLFAVAVSYTVDLMRQASAVVANTTLLASGDRP